VKRLRDGARLPHRASEQATGFDLYACLDSGPVSLCPVPVPVPTGIAMEFPVGFDVQVRPRSGLARRGVLSTFGTIDADYRGELVVMMYTTSPFIGHEIRDGDRIAQVVITLACDAAFIEVEDLSESIRGADGFGSTGR
jgi:dUTP pyrophosphatase